MKSVFKMGLKNLLIIIVVTVSIVRFPLPSINDLPCQSVHRRLKNTSEVDFGIKNRMQIAIGDRWNELKKALSLGDIESAQKILNEVNGYQESEKALHIGRVLNVLDFMSSSEYKEYRAKALSVLLNGGYAVEMFFAGAATRLRNSLEIKLGKDAAEKLAGPMYFVDIWKIAEALGYDIPREAIIGLGMGQRQFIQLNAALKQLAEKAGVDPNTVLSRQKIVLHINSEIEERVRVDLVEHNFYGFKPENIIILVQPVLPGYKISDAGELTVDESSKKYPYGHGYALEQIAQKGAGYTLSQNGSLNYITGSALDYLAGKGVAILAVNRVNDLTKFSPQILDVDKIAYALKLMEDGYNITAELVYNPKGQKGAVFLKDEDGRQFFLEGISSKTTELQIRLDELRQEAERQNMPTLPNNVTRIMFNIKGLSEIFSSLLPMNIRLRDGRLYPELLSGDITRLEGTDTAGIMKGKEFIQDFKELKDLDLAIKYLMLQDSDENFRAAAENFLK